MTKVSVVKLVKNILKDSYQQTQKYNFLLFVVDNYDDVTFYDTPSKSAVSIPTYYKITSKFIVFVALLVKRIVMGHDLTTSLVKEQKDLIKSVVIE